MEISINDIISVLGLLAGGGGLTYFLTWKYQKRKQKAEVVTAEAGAMSAEAMAAKELQDVYQQLINDIKADRDEQKAYIQELKDDRKHLRQERDDLRKRQDALEETVRDLQRDVARNGRMVEAMRPFLCGRSGCLDRIAVAMSDIVEAERKGGNDGN